MRVNKRSGALAFHRADGSLVTRERDDSPADIEPVRIDGEPSYAIRHSFTLTPDESLYGPGQYLIAGPMFIAFVFLKSIPTPCAGQAFAEKSPYGVIPANAGIHDVPRCWIRDRAQPGLS